MLEGFQAKNLMFHAEDVDEHTFLFLGEVASDAHHSSVGSLRI